MPIWSRASFAALSMSALLLAGCAVEATPEPVDQIVEAEVEQVEIEVPRHPLTGVELGTASLSGPVSR